MVYTCGVYDFNNVTMNLEIFRVRFVGGRENFVGEGRTTTSTTEMATDIPEKNWVYRLLWVSEMRNKEEETCGATTFFARKHYYEEGSL